MDLKLGMELLPISKLLNRVGGLGRNVVSRMKITSYLLFYDLAEYQLLLLYNPISSPFLMIWDTWMEDWTYPEQHFGPARLNLLLINPTLSPYRP
jgi:hypothetical protein